MRCVYDPDRTLKLLKGLSQYVEGSLPDPINHVTGEKIPVDDVWLHGVHEESVSVEDQCCGLPQHKVLFDILRGNVEIIDDPITDLLSDYGHNRDVLVYVDDFVLNILFGRLRGYNVMSLFHWLNDEFDTHLVTS